MPQTEAPHTPLSVEGKRLRRAVDAVPGGDRVPDEALEREARHVVLFENALRHTERQKTLRKLGASLRDIAGYAMLVGALQTRGAARDAQGDSEGYLLLGGETIQHASSQESIIPPEGMPAPGVMRRELAEAFGQQRFREVIPVERSDLIAAMRDMRRELERHDEPLDVNGFEERFGIPDDAVQRMISETTPAAWHSKHVVDRITFSDTPIPMPPSYGIEGFAGGIMHAGAGVDAGTMELSPDITPSSTTDELLIHELAHAGDWLRSNTMAPEDRLTLLYAVHDRTQRANRIHFPYVESIRNANKGQERYLKTTEYFAELMAMALTIPAENREAWLQGFLKKATETSTDPDVRAGLTSGRDDALIVEWYLKRIDPEFRPWEAAKKREEIVKKSMMNIFEEQFKSALSDIPSPVIRTLLMQAFEDDQKGNMVELLSKLHEGRTPALSPESEAYVFAFRAAWTDRSWRFLDSVPDALRSAFDAFNGAYVELFLTQQDCAAFRDVTYSNTVVRLRKEVDVLRRALQDLSDTEQEALNGFAKEWDHIRRGEITIPDTPPKQLVALMER